MFSKKWFFIVAMMVVSMSVAQANDWDDAMAAVEREDYPQAVALLQPQAEAGDADAQVWMGYLYEKGLGVAQDMHKAVSWYEKAVEAGHSDAQFNLGDLYDQGNGVVQNYAKARELYEKAAAQGDARAQSNLGVMYEEGNGVPQDYAKARELYTQAAEQGNVRAQINLGALYVTGDVVDYDKAKMWWEKAAAQGDEDADLYLHLLRKEQRKAVIKSAVMKTLNKHLTQ